MAVDLFEEIVRGYLQSQNYFTIENVTYKPPSHTQTPSDIDLIALHANPQHSRRVLAVNCKGGHHGLRLGKDQPAKAYKELSDPDWGAAFCDKIRDLTNHKTFTHVAAVSILTGDIALWRNNRQYRKNIRNNELDVITLREMLLGLAKNEGGLHQNAGALKLSRLFRHAA